ncbi:histidinol-phosphate transaminase [Olivibacter sitiensis]|uniref:histidinol-phosphate transaminase n=1 Tax=Olivibacter sitiensis TaxID=376470 RepID=UPI00041BDEFE|nr:histidinol-phosphate transaminase [Olivibacter sitiensis]
MNTATFDLNALLRDNIKKLVPYSSARDEFKGEASILLDANENAFGSPLATNYNRYPDPLQWKLKNKIAEIKQVASQHIFLGNGSDEAIDILYRAFCQPGIDNAIIVPPTYGMYEVSAHINDVALTKVNLTPDYQLDTEGILAAANAQSKLLFICSPNNPTGNAVKQADVITLLDRFPGLVIVDEAYIDFADTPSFISQLNQYPNLVVMQTFSKAWGLAALRLGMAFASEDIIQVFNKIKPPYNINQATQEIVLQALDNKEQVDSWVKQTVEEREKLATALMSLDFVSQVYPSDANFILVKMDGARKVYETLVNKGIILRDRSKVVLCDACLRITVGTPEENEVLLKQLEGIGL